MTSTTATKAHASCVIARPQYFLTDSGTQFARGYDERTVVGYGRTLNAAVKRAGDWASVSGYEVFDGKTGEALGKLYTDWDKQGRPVWRTELRTW